MSTETFSRFFALLSLLCWVATVVTIATAYAAHRFGGVWSRRFDELRESGLWLAWIVALVTTLGSLYFSEVAHFTPCRLCWYQRIAMYPLAIVLLVAAARRDRAIAWYVVPVATIGALFAVYQTQLQAFPHQHSSFCSTTDPCTTRYVWEFGFVSLPFMALAAFVFVITMTLCVRRTRSEEES
ncbi:MAG TPA: disulfide oxidoreductase [Acidimicrobiia bacterium]|nr:disulfide oxidoreductase [Acidimicrobiia bacterium]